MTAPPVALLQKPEPAPQPFRGRRLNQDPHQDRDDGDGRDHLRTGRFRAEVYALCVQPVAAIVAPRGAGGGRRRDSLIGGHIPDRSEQDEYLDRM